MSARQAYGMMGWRCGYIAFPTPEAGAPADLGAQLTKVQDTIPICASQVTPSCTGTPVPNEGAAPAKHRALMSRIVHGHIDQPSIAWSRACRRCWSVLSEASH